MKYKITITAIVTILLLLLYIFFSNLCTKLPELTNYSIVSDSGTTIPAKLYSRKVEAVIDGEKQMVDEIMLSFDDALVFDELNVSDEEKVYKYLVIIPEMKIIGLCENAKALEENDGYTCQTDEEANKFTSIINNRAFFVNPPITDVSFTNDSITFNTYGVLKKYGKKIIIKIDE